MLTTAHKGRQLAVEYRDIDSLIPYVRNARTHSDTQIAQLAASLREFGWTNPVLVDGENGVIAGHGRLLAARKLGLDRIPVIELVHLTEAQKRAYILADNKLALNAGYDRDMLAIEVADLGELGYDLSLTGFSEVEIADLAPPEFTPASIGDQGRLDEKKKVCCPNCGYEFAPE
jgi:ParB family chromosome partitioning protein